MQKIHRHVAVVYHAMGRWRQQSRHAEGAGDRGGLSAQWRGTNKPDRVFSKRAANGGEAFLGVQRDPGADRLDKAVLSQGDVPLSGPLAQVRNIRNSRDIGRAWRLCGVVYSDDFSDGGTVVEHRVEPLMTCSPVIAQS